MFVSMMFEVTDITDDIEIQWVAEGVVTVEAGSAYDGETSYQFLYQFEYLGP
ncbi:unnamed protein product [marine sediment metagenome]|uniref:Uncharacterized protein n=1 Tax=marine sediment metagenome TaxID=412755 RepID=X1EF45_9ZZZZ